MVSMQLPPSFYLSNTEMNMCVLGTHRHRCTTSKNRSRLHHKQNNRWKEETTRLCLCEMDLQISKANFVRWKRQRFPILHSGNAMYSLHTPLHVKKRISIFFHSASAGYQSREVFTSVQEDSWRTIMRNVSSSTTADCVRGSEACARGLHGYLHIR